MLTQRRTFLRSLATLTGGTLLTSWLQPLSAETQQQLAPFEQLNTDQITQNEEFWGIVRQAFTTSPNMINLNSGGVSPHPTQVKEAVESYTRTANEAPGFYMWRSMQRERRHMMEKLAELAGVDVGEIALQRNTTEAINAVLLGLDWRPGDEIVTSDQVYPAMDHALRQLNQRQGVKITKIPLPTPAPDHQSIVNAFEEVIGSQTRLVLVMHVVNISGQIMPVKEITEIAHARGAEVLVDGAHSFAQLDFKIKDLGVDYFATSLHKWLCAPFGTGLLYIKKEKIAGVWPIFAPPEAQEDQMIKFEHLGTRSVPTELAVSHAIDFHNWIGIKRKQARLHYLKKRWTDQMEALPNVHLNTNPDPTHSCAIANFNIAGKDMVKMGQTFLRNHNIYTTISQHKDVTGMRISPNIFTLESEIDYLVTIIRKYAD